MKNNMNTMGTGRISPAGRASKLPRGRAAYNDPEPKRDPGKGWGRSNGETYGAGNGTGRGKGRR